MMGGSAANRRAGAESQCCCRGICGIATPRIIPGESDDRQFHSAAGRNFNCVWADPGGARDCAHEPALPTRLGNVAVHITDSVGVTRIAKLLYTGAGWSEITFIVPANSALGPAEVAIVRTDGSRSTGKVLIANIAPGFWTASQDGRGARSALSSSDFRTVRCEHSRRGSRTRSSDHPTSCRTPWAR